MLKGMIAFLYTQYSDDIIELTICGMEGDTFNRVNEEHKYTL